MLPTIYTFSFQNTVQLRLCVNPTDTSHRAWTHCCGHLCVWSAKTQSVNSGCPCQPVNSPQLLWICNQSCCDAFVFIVRSPTGRHTVLKWPSAAVIAGTVQDQANALVDQQLLDPHPLCLLVSFELCHPLRHTSLLMCFDLLTSTCYVTFAGERCNRESFPLTPLVLSMVSMCLCIVQLLCLSRLSPLLTPVGSRLCCSFFPNFP